MIRKRPDEFDSQSPRDRAGPAQYSSKAAASPMPRLENPQQENARAHCMPPVRFRIPFRGGGAPVRTQEVKTCAFARQRAPEPRACQWGEDAQICARSPPDAGLPS